MPIPEHVTPTNLRRIEFTSWDSEKEASVARGQAWVNEHGYVQGDTEYVNLILDGGIGCPNVLAEPPRGATREDGAVMLYGLCLEATNATYWGIRIVEVAEDDRPSGIRRSFF